MSDKITKKEKSGINKMLIAFITMCFVAGGLSVILHGSLKNTKKLKETSLYMTEKISKMINENETLMKHNESCEKEMDSLTKRLEGIKNTDDLLKRDIFLYIDKKFQLIPRTVALDIAEQILLMAKKENVSPELIVGIIQVESSFNPMAISKKNARGLMQVMPEWAKKFNLKRVSDLHDIDTNIQCGIKVLKIHIEEGKGSISKGLYYYVGKSESYAGKVYEAMGKFVAFRSTIDDDESDIDINGNGDQAPEKEGEQPDADVNGAKSDSH